MSDPSRRQRGLPKGLTLPPESRSNRGAGIRRLAGRARDRPSLIQGGDRDFTNRRVLSVARTRCPRYVPSLMLVRTSISARAIR